MYVRAQQHLGRPPKSVDELKPFAKDVGDLDKLLVSGNDGQPLVVVWGADYASTDDKELVIAYERAGAKGFRHVLTPSGTRMLSDDQFTKATFPSGHKPAGP